MTSTRYRVHMYRWGDPKADHTYEAADLDSLAAAMVRADAEVDYRGGKYGAVVWMCPPAADGPPLLMATVGMRDMPRVAP
jgi:hypothetical protein